MMSARCCIEAEQQQIPVAFIDFEYDGQFTFPALLRQPLAVVPAAQAHGWAAQHPDGWLLFILDEARARRQPAAPAAGAPLPRFDALPLLGPGTARTGRVPIRLTGWWQRLERMKRICHRSTWNNGDCRHSPPRRHPMAGRRDLLITLTLAAHCPRCRSRPHRSDPADDSMMQGRNGARVTPLFTVGETVTPDDGGEGYQPVGVLDGLGAYRLDADTVRLWVNHELADDKGRPYRLANGTLLRGARISQLRHRPAQPHAASRRHRLRRGA
jgi:hypothetical protein